MEKKPCFPTVLVVNLFKTPEKKYVRYVCNITSIDYNLKYVDAGLARNENDRGRRSIKKYIYSFARYTASTQQCSDKTELFTEECYVSLCNSRHTL